MNNNKKLVLGLPVTWHSMLWSTHCKATVHFLHILGHPSNSMSQSA